MKVLFIVYSKVKVNSSDGISKKIEAQADALRKQGLDVDLFHFTDIDGTRHWAVNGRPIAKIGSGVMALMRHYFQFAPLYRYIKRHGVSTIYLRYVHNATPAMLWFLKRIKKLGVKIIFEIPTYPYDGEYRNMTGISRLRMFAEKKTRMHLSRYCDRIATFSDDSEIFGVPTINLSNAVDLAAIPLRNNQKPHEGFKILGVANINFWHGYDRLLAGLANYYKGTPDVNVKFTVVGGGDYMNVLKQQAREYGVLNHVVFKGSLGGVELDREFEDADLCAGCLGCHRKNITEVKSLKNVEYAARGIPFVYSENNNDFDRMPYVIKMSPDDSPVDIPAMLERFKAIDNTAAEIRSSVSDLTWDIQMKKVSDFIKSC